KGERRSVDSGMVNEYIRNICSEGYTTKDFRTWLGTVYAIEELSKLGPGETETQKKEKIVAAIDRVAARLGNTRAVCRKYYVHPAIITLYTDNKLDAFVSKPRAKSFSPRLSDAECVLLSILAQHS
ncbi:MAG TPA: DNA topoisomerase IB, partial [Chitinophagaceae bacterium]